MMRKVNFTLCGPIFILKYYSMHSGKIFVFLNIVVCSIIVETSIVTAKSSTLRWNSDKHPQQKF